MAMLLLLVGCALPPPGVPAFIDDDGDGSPASEDCDDSDPVLFPGAEWPIDADGDGWQSGTSVACAPPAEALVGESLGDDCDDSDPERNAIGLGYGDGDGDGFGGGTSESFCGAPPQGYLLIGDDCDDAHPRAHPGALEDCGVADLDCLPGNDPTCLIWGTQVLQLTGNEWVAEVGIAPPELDMDARADAVLLGDYVDVGDTLIARWFDLGEVGQLSAPREYILDRPLPVTGHSLEFFTFPDLNDNGAPDVWLVYGDYDAAQSLLWDLDAIPLGGVLNEADAFLARGAGDPFPAVGGASDAALDLRDEAGVEVALRAFELGFVLPAVGRVEIWGGFDAAPPELLSLLTAPPDGTYFGADILASDLDGDGVTDLAVTESRDDQLTESLYVFHGPFPADRNAADADASFVLGGGNDFTLGQVEPAEDLLGDGRSWLYWGAPESYFGGRVVALPGTLTTMTPTDPLTLEFRSVRAPDYPGFGAAMDLVADQTGDGVADLLVGAPNWVGLGSEACFLLDSNEIAFGAPDPTVDSAAVAARFLFDGRFGYVVSAAGDVDGDGGEDVWIGADGPAFLLYGGVLP